jgi:hypothetical protein
VEAQLLQLAAQVRHRIGPSEQHGGVLVDVLRAAKLGIDVVLVQVADMR